MTSLHSRYIRFATALFAFTMWLVFSSSCYSQTCVNFIGKPTPGAGYLIRNGYVYYANYSPVFAEAASWTGQGKDDYDKSRGISIVDGADANTFHEISKNKSGDVCKPEEKKFSVYGRDDFHVYLNAHVLHDADAATFELVDKYYARDRLNVFFMGEKVVGANPANFQSLDFGFARDKRSVFSGTMMLEGADPNTFQSIFHSYGKDSFHVYHVGQGKSIIVGGADPQTFRLLEWGFSKDARHVFHEDNWVATIVNEADPISFTVLSNGYAKDRKHVYFARHKTPMETVVVKGADPRTFKEWVKGSYSTDGRNWFLYERMIPGLYLEPIPDHPQFAITKTKVYYRGNPIPGADPATFVAEGKGYDISRDKNHVYYSTELIPFLPSMPMDQLADSHPGFEDEIEIYLGQKKRILKYEQDAKIARLNISRMGVKALQDPVALEVAMQDVLRHGNLADTDYLRHKLGLDVEIPASNVAKDNWFLAIIRSSPDYLAVPFSYAVETHGNTSTITITLIPNTSASISSWGRDWQVFVKSEQVMDAAGNSTTLAWPGKGGIQLSEFHEIEIRQKIAGRFSFHTSPNHHIDSGDALAQTAAEILGSGDLRDYQKVAKTLHTEMFAQPDQINLWYGHTVSNEKLIPGIIASQISYFEKDSEWNAMSFFSVAASRLSDRTVNIHLPLDLRLVCLSPERIAKWLDLDAVRYEMTPLKDDEMTFSTKGDNDISLHVQIANGCAASLDFGQKTDVAHSPATFAVYDLNSSLSSSGEALNSVVLAKIDTLVSHLQVPKLTAINIFEHLPLGAPEETRTKADELAKLVQDALTSRGISGVPIHLHGPEKPYETYYGFAEESAVGVDATLGR